MVKGSNLCHRLLLALQALVLMFGVITLQPALAASDEEEEGRGDLVLNGDAICTRCHDEYEYYPVLSIGKTPHGTRADERTPTCTNCHGESQSHIDNTDDSGARLPTDVRFINAPSPSEQRNQSCMSCHSGESRIHWENGAHALNQVACNDCHRIHNEGQDAMLTATSQTQRCSTCHTKQRSDSLKLYRHLLGDGALSCSNCHNPHGSPGPSELKRFSVVDTCYQCHAEKRGPYLWQHQPVNQDCALCHQPHGSNVSGMLKARVPLLCQECHEGDGHRGLPPDTNSVMANRRACVNCHVNIHGSNSPSSGFGARSMRQ